MTPRSELETGKREYAKPRLRMIELAAEEVLATGCKLESGSFASGNSPCVNANNCSEAGS